MKTLYKCLLYYILKNFKCQYSHFPVKITKIMLPPSINRYRIGDNTYIVEKRKEIMEKIFEELHEAYINSAQGQKGCMICLVGIRNREKIIDSHMSLRQILEMSQVPVHYSKELALGLNLSKYVDLKEGFR